MAKNHGNKPLFSVGMSFDEVGPLRAMVGGWREGSLNFQITRFSEDQRMKKCMGHF